MKKLIFLTIMIAFFIGCKDTSIDKNQIIASWRDGNITIGEFEDFAYEEMEYDSLEVYKLTNKDKKDMLNKMINFEIVELLADSLKLDTLEYIKEIKKNTISSIAYRKFLLKDSVLNKFIDDNMIIDTYNKMKIRYKAAHILLVTDNKNKSKVKTRIDSIYKAVINIPDSFPSFAKQFSDDVRTGRVGGDLGWNLAPSYIPDFEKQLLKLKPGEISKPFKTQYGWHIVKLLNTKPNTKLKSFEIEKGNAISKIIGQNNKIYEKYFSDFQAFLNDRYKVKIDSANIIDFTKKYNREYSKSRDIEKIINNLRPNRVFVTMKNDTIFSRDIFPLFRSAVEIRKLELENIRSAILSLTNQKIISKITSDLDYSSKQDVLVLARKAMQSYYRKHIFEKFKVDEETSESYLSSFHNNFNVSINLISLESSLYNTRDIIK